MKPKQPKATRVWCVRSKSGTVLAIHRNKCDAMQSLREFRMYWRTAKRAKHYTVVHYRLVPERKSRK